MRRRANQRASVANVRSPAPDDSTIKRILLDDDDRRRLSWLLTAPTRSDNYHRHTLAADALTISEVVFCRTTDRTYRSPVG